MMEPMQNGIETLIERSEWTMKKLETLEIKVDKLNAFKFKSVGVGSAIGAIAAFVAQMVWSKFNG
jgi:ribosome-associated toxin RatA of RatAB toxin-antitoxin module